MQHTQGLDTSSPCLGAGRWIAPQLARIAGKSMNPCSTMFPVGPVLAPRPVRTIGKPQLCLRVFSPGSASQRCHTAAPACTKVWPHLSKRFDEPPDQSMPCGPNPVSTLSAYKNEGCPLRSGKPGRCRVSVHHRGTAKQAERRPMPQNHRDCNWQMKQVEQRAFVSRHTCTLWHLWTTLTGRQQRACSTSGTLQILLSRSPCQLDS
jgi:hypothetical protein